MTSITALIIEIAGAGGAVLRMPLVGLAFVRSPGIARPALRIAPLMEPARRALAAVRGAVATCTPGRRELAGEAA